MKKTITLEMGGIFRKYLVEYFLAIGGKTEDQEMYAGDYWNVQIGPEVWRSLGSIHLNHVSVTINVEEDKFDEFLAKFRLRFLQAGG